MLSPLVARMIREEEVRNKRKNNSSLRMLFIFKERHKTREDVLRLSMRYTAHLVKRFLTKLLNIALVK